MVFSPSISVLVNKINFKRNLIKGKYDYKNANASLDRIDPNIGYKRDNIQWVHKDINRMKQHYPEVYFVEMCGKVTDYICQKNGDLTISNACGILCPR